MSGFNFVDQPSSTRVVTTTVLTMPFKSTCTSHQSILEVCAKWKLTLCIKLKIAYMYWQAKALACKGAVPEVHNNYMPLPRMCRPAQPTWYLRICSIMDCMISEVCSEMSFKSRLSNRCVMSLTKPSGSCPHNCSENASASIAGWKGEQKCTIPCKSDSLKSLECFQPSFSHPGLLLPAMH